MLSFSFWQKAFQPLEVSRATRRVQFGSSSWPR